MIMSPTLPVPMTRYDLPVAGAFSFTVACRPDLARQSTPGGGCFAG